MSLIKVHRQSDLKHEFKDGVSRQNVLVGEYSQASFEKCAIKAGSKWAPELFEFGEKVQIFIFTKGKGYITTPRKSFEINEITVFVPEFDVEEFVITCSSDSSSDLEFLRIQGLMSDYDVEDMSNSRMTLPRFRTVSQAWTYEEPFKGPGTTSCMLIEHRNLGRFSMGATLGQGPTFVGNHIHNELEQWYFALPGSSFTYTAEDESIEIYEGDLTYTVHGSVHGSTAKEGQQFDYIWFELCEDGYPGGIL